MRGSENTWQQTIEAAPPAEMLPSDVLSGHVIFETSFFNDDQLLGKTSVRIYYV
jgi:retinal rod rhodopsin-sensitive cGMP 3',5'-cyclic phosphodiesterase subunit delta